MLCREIMKTNVIVAGRKEPASKAAAIMRDLNLGFLPVCDMETGAVEGIVTDRDLAIRVLADNKPANTLVGKVATPALVFCNPDDDVLRAQELMQKNRVARLLCVDRTGRIAGVVSLSDIADKVPDLAAATLHELSKRELGVL
jgi:CBS domain-containing protein